MLTTRTTWTLALPGSCSPLRVHIASSSTLRSLATEGQRPRKRRRPHLHAEHGMGLSHASKRNRPHHRRTTPTNTMPMPFLLQKYKTGCPQKHQFMQIAATSSKQIKSYWNRACFMYKQLFSDRTAKPNLWTLRAHLHSSALLAAPAYL